MKRLDLKGANNGVELTSTGPEELMLMEQVRADVKDIEGVRVLEYKLGYNDDTTSYCVAAYEEALAHPFKEISGDEGLSPLRVRYERMLQEVGEAINQGGRKYSDFGGNVAYDVKTDQFILSDLILYEGKPDKAQ